MEDIDSLDQLIEKLQDSTRRESVRAITSMDIPIAEYKPFQTWNEAHYTRNCISRTEDYELLLLCWEKGQETPIHCHNGEECWVYAVKGKLFEERYDYDNSDNLNILNHATYNQGQLSYMSDDMGYHLLRNIDNGRSMSLHLYMSPIDECTYFDESKGMFIAKELEYDSVEGEIIVHDSLS